MQTPGRHLSFWFRPLPAASRFLRRFPIDLAIVASAS
jgi:hypothetical protein